MTDLRSQPTTYSEHQPALVIRMSSGRQHRVHEIFLVAEKPLREAQALALSVEASASLPRGSNFLGFAGSPAWVLGVSLVLGLWQSLAENSARNSAVTSFMEIERLSKLSVAEGAYVPVSDIGGIECADPRCWRGAFPTDPVGFKRYVYDADPFVKVLTAEDGFLSIAWDKVESYSPPLPQRLVVEQMIAKYGIVFDGNRFQYRGMSYDKAEDAINFAELQIRRALTS